MILEIDIDCSELTNDQIAAALRGIANDIYRDPLGVLMFVSFSIVETALSGVTFVKNCHVVSRSDEFTISQCDEGDMLSHQNDWRNNHVAFPTNWHSLAR
jgi:hypothetical protein